MTVALIEITLVPKLCVLKCRFHICEPIIKKIWNTYSKGHFLSTIGTGATTSSLLA